MLFLEWQGHGTVEMGSLSQTCLARHNCPGWAQICEAPASALQTWGSGLDPTLARKSLGTFTAFILHCVSCLVKSRLPCGLFPRNGTMRASVAFLVLSWVAGSGQKCGQRLVLALSRPLCLPHSGSQVCQERVPVPGREVHLLHVGVRRRRRVPGRL